MRYRILGPLEVSDGRRWAEVSATKVRALLALLLLRANQAVTGERLLEELWGERPPATARKVLQGYVLRLRGVLGDRAGQRLQTCPSGYRLVVRPGELDLHRFEELAEQGRGALSRGALDTAAARLREALETWRGPAFADVPATAAVGATAARLETARLSVLEARLEADLALGRHAQVLAEVHGLVAEHPLHEGLCARLMLALYRDGRQADALAVYRDLRARLVDELGVEPGPELQRLERAILMADPSLELSARRATAVPHQLPPDVATFTGRGAELGWLAERLGGAAAGAVAICAIHGSGGIGKSALAVHAAHRLAERFGDGQLYADLQGATAGLPPLPPLEVLGRFLRALGASGEDVPLSVQEAAARFRSLLAQRRVLVVLDNARDAAQVQPLLPASPGCGVLVTSRQLLGAVGGAEHLRLEVLPHAEAVELLARLVGKGRVDGEPEAAATIGRLCGYLPLALRIAAARLVGRPGWPLRAAAERLADARRRLDELRAGELDVRASFQVSCQGLLDSPDPVDRVGAAAFGLLGLPDGPDLSLPLAARLLDAPELAAERLLERLVDAQLLDSPLPGRYRMHDLVRLFARELAAAGEPEQRRLAALERLWRCQVATAQRASQLLHPGHRDVDADPAAALPLGGRAEAQAWLEAERSNLLASAGQAAEAPGKLALTTVRLAGGLFRFLHMRGYWSDAETLHQRALRVARRLGDPQAEAQALGDLGMAASRTARWDTAIGLFERALAIRRELGDRRGEGVALSNLGGVYQQLGKTGAAIACLQRDLAISRELGDRGDEGISLANLGGAYLAAADLPAAIDCLGRALETYREVGGHPAEGHALGNLGEAYLLAGDPAAAVGCLERALEICLQSGDRDDQGWILADLGEAHRRAGRPERAVGCCEEALAVCRQTGARMEEGRALWRLGLAMRDLDEPGRAGQCWRDALAVFTELSAPEANEVRQLLRELARVR